MAPAKHKFQQLIFNPAKQKLIVFLDELQKLAKDAFGVTAQAILDQFIYAKMPPYLKKSINQAHFENGTYKQIVTPRKGIWTKQFGISWWDSDEHCDAQKWRQPR